MQKYNRYEDEEASYYFLIMDIVSYMKKYGITHIMNDIFQRIQYEKDLALKDKFKNDQFEDVPF